ncbi:hypothetical protein LK994_10820 [Ferruginibacter lapsinanis]|uniref:hypothetical protein n=1 Tax=Ferruginibacter lapsinanis TaxID=563172 RepID=UPI001E520DB2|nr:hypothetical protein [Ferruginibacter lapsinanis]UEG49123.1 hypothetical protein LK994_10820 [Ferruginibacter lapsinanis]
MNQLEKRIIRLENRLKTYRIIFGSALTVFAAIMLMSHNNKPSVPEVIQAKAFEVVDNYGNVLLKLNKEDGNGCFTTYTNTGKKLVKLFTSTGGGGAINSFDENGEINFKVTKTIGGGGYMALFNSDRNEIVEFGATNNNTGYFNLNDKDGKKIAWLTYTENGGGYFALLNDDIETIRLSTPSEGGRVGISNKRNNRVVYMGTQDDLDGNITISNASGSKLGSIPANY